MHRIALFLSISKGKSPYKALKIADNGNPIENSRILSLFFLHFALFPTVYPYLYVSKSSYNARRKARLFLALPL